VTHQARNLKVGYLVAYEVGHATAKPSAGVLANASPCVTASPASRLAVLARAVARLSSLHHDPETFHEDKSEIAAELRRLAQEIAA